MASATNMNKAAGNAFVSIYTRLSSICYTILKNWTEIQNKVVWGFELSHGNRPPDGERE